MNYLGHSMFPLKNRKDKVVFGNVCGDFYKGSINSLVLDEEVKEGIILHRALDSITDSNEYFLKNKRLLSNHRLYSGVIVDIFHDYFLAKHFDKFSTLSLKQHSEKIYSSIEVNKHLLNEKGQKTFYWMEKYDWLTNYNNIEFIERVLQGISSRFKRDNNLYESVNELKIHYSEFEDNFFMFWEDLNENSRKINLK